MTAVLFVDFEASSLSLSASYPIEAAWLQIDAATGEPLAELESYLIRPATSWTDWSPESEKVHRIRRDLLEKRGKPISVVARKLLAATEVCGGVIVSDSSWDEVWARQLLEAAVMDPHALRWEASSNALARAMGTPLATVSRLYQEILPQMPKPKHRAGADVLRARALWQLCLEARWSVDDTGT